MVFRRCALLGGGVVTIGSIGLGCWIQQKFRLVPIPDREALSFRRIGEVAFASFQAKQIEDKFTAEKHVEAVATLSSKLKVSEKSGQQRKEIDKLRLNYRVGYLQGVFSDNPSLSSFVFGHRENLPIMFPAPLEESRRGFVFSGPLYSLHDLKSRQDIWNGNYIRCKPHLRQADVFITGTKDFQKCEQLKTAVLKDAAMIASGILWNKQLPAEDPISKTPVFDCAKRRSYKFKGNLTRLDQSTQLKILGNEFTTCHFHSLEVVITGMTDKDTCRDFYLRYMPQVLNTATTFKKSTPAN